MSFLGLALMMLGSFALLMMHVTGNIPSQWPMKWRDEDPSAYRWYQASYAVITAIGLVLLCVGLLSAR